MSEEGHQSAFIEAVTIEARAQMVTPIVEGDPSPPPPPRGPKYLALASTDPNVAEALRYLASDLDALRLRKAYEVIKDDVGGEHELVNKGLAASKGVLDRFRAPLISQDVSGDDALHARSKRKAVKNDMDLSEARGFLLGLALRWMDSKLPPS